MAIKIVITDQSGSELSYELEQTIITFGRSKSCHIELGNPNVSRRHFLIKYNDNAYVIMDVGSRQGTMLDGQKITSLVAYTLGKCHTVLIPGFSIKIYSDEKSPKMNKTVVVMRNLFDELLHNKPNPRSCASLHSTDGKYCFKFIEEKTVFVLGSWFEVDFHVKDQKIYKKHVSFAHDINGIQLIPLPGHLVLFNGQSITEPTILSSGSIIKLGETEFIFCEHGQEPKTLEQKSLCLNQALSPKEPLMNPQPPKFSALDNIFYIAFLVLLASASFLLYEML